MKKSNADFVSAVIVAAGKGTRMNMDINKQFVEILDRPVLAWTLQVFEDCRSIKDIILVVADQDIIYCKQNIVDLYGFKKVRVIVAGGEERQHSVYNGLKEVDNRTRIVVIHDGARPFVTRECLAGVIKAAEEFGVASSAVPVKDTIKKANSDGFVEESLDRNTLWAIHTPQAFRYNLIMEAHKKAADDGFIGTDDTVLTERLGMKTRLVVGSYENIKITTQEDLIIAQAIAESRII